MNFDRRIVPLVLVALLVVLPARLLADDAAAPTRDVLFNCPDPAVIQPAGGNDVYVFSTGRGIPFFRSDDLVHWQSAGRVFDRDVPLWAKAAVPNAQGIWAPDIRWLNGRYHLYYAVSTFGSQRSVIGLAVNKTLDSANPDYRWDDRGLIIESAPGKTDFNAIDPAMFVDRDNLPYLFWGSYWSGIKATKIDPDTGKPPEGPLQVTAVAQRAKEVDPPSIEAPYVMFHCGGAFAPAGPRKSAAVDSRLSAVARHQWDMPIARSGRLSSISKICLKISLIWPSIHVTPELTSRH